MGEHEYVERQQSLQSEVESVGVCGMKLLSVRLCSHDMLTCMASVITLQ